MMAAHHIPLLLLLLLSIIITPTIISAFTYRDITAKANQKHLIISEIDFPTELEVDVSSTLLPARTLYYDARNRLSGRRYRCLVLRASSGSDEEKKGYQFGDITKSLIGRRVEKITGKPYEFGDLSRKVDSSIKDKINDLTGNEDYEFGDLSRYADSKIKDEVNKATGNESYQFGDLTKEIVRRVASGKYTLDDLFMLFKALALVGASLSPVAGFLPVKLLVELLNFSLLNDVAGKVTSSLAIELDKRLKRSLLGDEDYKLGDATKRTIANAVEGYIGKDYEFGDITKKVVESFADDAKISPNNKQTIGGAKDTESEMIDALDKWDSLSEKELQAGLDKIEKYVELVEQEQKHVETQ